MSEQDMNMPEYVWIYNNRQGSECLLQYIVWSYSTNA